MSMQALTLDVGHDLIEKWMLMVEIEKLDFLLLH